MGVPVADELIEVRVPLLVTEDGKWGASGCSDAPEPDWIWLDELCDRDKAAMSPKRYWITVYVKQHKAEGIEGSVTDAD